jgi:hypothetical protein
MATATNAAAADEFFTFLSRQVVCMSLSVIRLAENPIRGGVLASPAA